MEEKQLNDIIRLEQLPIITSQLDLISKDIEKRVTKALKLECNEDTVKEIKQVRADFNKEFKVLEDKRKQVKSAIMEKYDTFEEIYKDKISNIYKNADEELKDKIDSVENELKEEKTNELKEFVEEHCKANNVHIDFDRIGLNITLSASMKSLKEQAKEFIEKVANDLKLIEMESQYKDEILLEYQNDYDYVNAKTRVLEKQKQLKEIQAQREQRENIEQQEQQVVDKVEETIEITTPVEIDEEINTYQFEVKATKTQIKKLIDYMKELGIEYK